MVADLDGMAIGQLTDACNYAVLTPLTLLAMKDHPLALQEMDMLFKFQERILRQAVEYVHAYLYHLTDQETHLQHQRLHVLQLQAVAVVKHCRDVVQIRKAVRFIDVQA
jgi:hypothetical protein